MKKNTLHLLKQAVAVGISLCLVGLQTPLASAELAVSGAERASAAGNAGAAGSALTHVLSVPFSFSNPALAGISAFSQNLVSPTQLAGVQSFAAASQLQAAALAQGQSAADAASVQAAALLESGRRVDSHPVLSIIDELQRAGVPISGIPQSAADVEALKTAIEKNVPDGKARRDLLAFASALSFSQGAAQGEGLEALYDNVSAPYHSPHLIPEVQASPAGFWGWMAKRNHGWFGLKAYAAWRVSAARKAKTIDIDALRVPAEKLRYVPKAEDLPESTADIPPSPEQVVGQPRGMKSLEYGLQMEGGRYNVIVTGAEGSGRQKGVELLLKGPGGFARSRPTPPDRIAVTDPKDRDEKIFLELAPGNAVGFQAVQQKILAALKQILPEQLMSGPVAKQKRQMHSAFEQFEEQEFEKFNADHTAQLKNGRYGIRVTPTENGIGVQITVDGQVLNDGQVEALVQKEAADASITDKFTKEKVEQAKGIFTADIERITSSGEFGQMMARLSEKHMETHAQMEQFEQQKAGEMIFQLGQSLFALTEDAAFTGFRHRMAQRKAAFDAKVGETKILDKFGLQIESDGEGGLSVAVTYKDPALAELGPLAQIFGAALTTVIGGEKDLEALKTRDDSIPADLTWEKLAQAAEGAARGFVDRFNDMQEENQKDFASLPEASEASARAKAYVKSFLMHMAQNYKDFLPTMVEQGDVMALLQAQQKEDPAKAYRVDIIATNKPGSGAPVVVPNSTRFKRIFGYYEDKMRFPLIGMAKEAPGGPQIVTGSLLEANGGYLVLDLLDVLREPGVYEALMRMLKSGVAEIREEGFMSFILDRGDHYEIPVKVKVVFIGSPLLAMLLKHYDPDFERLFKITAEFEYAIRIAEENVAGYLKFMRAMIDKSGGAMLHFAKSGIQSVLEGAARRVDSNEKFTAQFELIKDLMSQASKWAELRLEGQAASRAARSGKSVQAEIEALKQEGAYQVTREDVEKAEDEIRERVGSYKRRLYELFAQGSFRIDLGGAKKDSITAMAIMGDFGVPGKVSARTSAKSGGEIVISAEQQAKLTGSSFDQSLEVLKGFLEGLFGELKDLPFKIRIKFEQNYGGIDGDSATQTMMYLALASLAGLKIKQGVAITGSADQEGNVRVIGGLKDKIAGFWDVATEMLRQEKQDPNYIPTKEDGLSVIFPADNIRQLALRADVAKAVEEGRLRLIPVVHISQGAEALFEDEDGNRVPFARVLELVQERIAKMRKAARKAA